MNLTSTEAAGYLDTLRPLVADLPDRRLFVLLPFTSIWVARDRLAGTSIGWGAQDVHPDDAGAHTGDVSAPMLADLGCTYVEVGHHERRRDHGETDELIAAKIAAVAALGNDRDPVRRRAGAAADSSAPSRSSSGSCPPFAADRSRSARSSPTSRPGRSASAPRRHRPTGSGRVHAAIRADARRRRTPTGSAVPIIYGGSVSLEAAPALLAQPAVDGLFVGRQALDPTVFAAIAHVQPAGDGVPRGRMNRVVMWSATSWPGTEHLEIREGPDSDRGRRAGRRARGRRGRPARVPDPLRPGLDDAPARAVPPRRGGFADLRRRIRRPRAAGRTEPAPSCPSWPAASTSTSP